jgi:hypothetical protein
MGDKKKKVVSIRIHDSDHNKIKLVAKRLQVRESDVFRYAIKSTLKKTSPLQQDKPRQDEVIAMLVDLVQELTYYLGLDSEQMQSIVAELTNRHINDLDDADMELLVLSGMPDRNYLARLQQLANIDMQDYDPDNALRNYLLDKYAAPADCV